METTIRLAEKRAELAAFFASKKGEDGQYAMSDEDKTEYATREAEIKALAAQVELAKVEAANAEELKGLEQVRRTAVVPGAQTEEKSFAQAILESAAFKGYQKGMPVGPLANVNVDFKAVFTSTAGMAPQVTRSGRIDFVPTYPETVLDIMPVEPTGQVNTLRYQRETWVNATGETAEGALYPEATIAITDVDVPIRKVAVFLPISDEELEDIPRIESLLDGRLTKMVKQRLNGQILVGTGVAPNLLGLNAVVGVNVQAMGADTPADAIFKGLQLIRGVGAANPTHIVMNPAEWSKIRLAKAVGSGNYLTGVVTESGQESLWGIPVIQSPSQTAGVALAFDADHVALAVRRDMDVQIGYDNDDFSHGKKTIRADVRVAVVCYRPQAVTRITGL